VRGMFRMNSELSFISTGLTITKYLLGSHARAEALRHSPRHLDQERNMNQLE
jgi:hypothetical protein